MHRRIFKKAKTLLIGQIFYEKTFDKKKLFERKGKERHDRERWRERERELVSERERVKRERVSE